MIRPRIRIVIVIIITLDETLSFSLLISLTFTFVSQPSLFVCVDSFFDCGPPLTTSATAATTQPKKVARKKNLTATGGLTAIHTSVDVPPSMITTQNGIKGEGVSGIPSIPKEGKEGQNAATKEHNNMVKMMREMNSQQSLNSNMTNGEKNKENIRNEKENKNDFSNSYSHISVSAERKFFDQAKELLTSVSRESWTEFVRCLDLFSCDAVTKKDLLALVQDLFGPANSELYDEFKVLMAVRANYTANASDMWYATPLSEIDFSQCRKCTPSYRALPKSYPKAVCSERSDVEASLLNDVWVGIPIGSEESYSFRFMRKNQYEEALFKCEDDQFEIDMIIDTNTSAIRILEPIAEEIGSLRLLTDSERAAPRFSFQLEKRSLGTVHLNAVTRCIIDSNILTNILYLTLFLYVYIYPSFLSLFLAYLYLYLYLYLSLCLSRSFPLCLSLILYLSIYLSISLSIYLSVYLFIYLCIYLFIYLSIYLYLCIYPFIYPSIYLTIYLLIYLSIYLSISQSIYPIVYLSI